MNSVVNVRNVEPVALDSSAQTLLDALTTPADNQNIKIGDSPSRDSFGRLRTSHPTGLFDSQFTYDLQPLLYEQITNGAGATVTHDATNRNALMTFSATPTGGKSFMQTYQFFRYQPGKSQKINITFNFIGAVADALKFVGYSDGSNGIEFQNTGAVNRFVVYSTTTNGNVIKNQADWNLDTLNPAFGNNPSGITLDITKSQHLVIDLEALYTGRVRVGFDINGEPLYCHEFLFENTVVHPYIATANLPIRAGMTCTGTVSTTMKYQCCAVISEGGNERTIGFEFAQDGTVSASSGARTHAITIRPKQTFNSIVNRSTVYYIEIGLLVTGANPVKWELVLGQAITGTTTFTDVNATYSSMEYNTAGTISGAPVIVVDQDFVASSNQAKGQGQMDLTFRYPITLDAAGNHRALGALTLDVTGLGGASAVYYTIKWTEVR